jgi:signal peptidase I
MNVALIFLFLAALYLVINLGLPHLAVDPLMRTYLLQPLLWVCFFLAVRRLPGYNPLARHSRRVAFFQLGLAIAFVQVLIYVIGGLFTGFGKNPSSLTPLGIMENLFFVGTMLASMEFGRAWLVTNLGKKHSFLALTLVALFFTFISLPLSQIRSFTFHIESINLVMSSWAPLLAENLLASYLAMVAGARASLAYRGLLAAFWWLCPVLPDLTWSLKGLIGVGVPILGMVAANSYYSENSAPGRSRRKIQKGSFPAGWIITALGCVILIWFSVGVFPFQPSLVGSGSMSPVLETGDIVIVAKVNAEKIKVGDIMEFRKDKETNIIHRVVRINQSGQTGTFTTKGDANNNIDTGEVNPDNVIGKVVFHIPKVGLISIVMKKIFAGGA